MGTTLFLIIDLTRNFCCDSFAVFLETLGMAT